MTRFYGILLVVLVVLDLCVTTAAMKPAACASRSVRGGRVSLLRYENTSHTSIAGNKTPTRPRRPPTGSTQATPSSMCPGQKTKKLEDLKNDPDGFSPRLLDHGDKMCAVVVPWTRPDSRTGKDQYPVVDWMIRMWEGDPKADVQVIEAMRKHGFDRFLNKFAKKGRPIADKILLDERTPGFKFVLLSDVAVLLASIKGGAPNAATNHVQFLRRRSARYLGIAALV